MIYDIFYQFHLEGLPVRDPNFNVRPVAPLMDTMPLWLKQESAIQQVGMLIEIQMVASNNEDFNLARVWWPFGKAVLSNRLQVSFNLNLI